MKISESKMKNFIAKSGKVVLINPKNEYKDLFNMLEKEGVLIKLDSMNTSYFNPLEINMSDNDELVTAMNRCETEIREIIKSLKENYGREQELYIANFYLEMANRQKDNLSVEWYNRIVKLCNEYINK